MCSTADDFAVDMGALEIIGVTTEKDRKFTCINGQTCKLERIWGNHLMSSDYFAVLDTCGAFTSVDFVPMAGMTVGVDPAGPEERFYLRGSDSRHCRFLTCTGLDSCNFRSG